MKQFSEISTEELIDLLCVQSQLFVDGMNDYDIKECVQEIKTK